MADTKTQKVEREYVIPLRRMFVRVPQYERTGKAVKAIRQFIAKHMKIPGRDVSKVKLDVYFNNELWFRGRANPPAKVKVKAIKEGDIVRVEFVEIPQYVKFLQAKHAKLHVVAPTQPKAESKKEVKKPEEKTADQKENEKEKEKATAIEREKEMRADVKAQKHTTPVNETRINKNVLKQEHS